MAMDIVYGGFSFREKDLAVPLISLDTQLSTTAAGYLIGGTLGITLEGKIVADATNSADNYDPNAPGSKADDPKWSSLFSDVDTISKGFQDDYQKLAIICGDGAPKTTRPNTDIIWDLYQADPLSTKIISKSFTNNTDPQWMNVIDYQINLEVEITGSTEYLPSEGGPYFVTDIENSFSISPITDTKVYKGIGNGTNIMDNSNTRSSSKYASESVGNMFPFATGDSFPLYNISRTISARGRATKPSHANHPSTAVQNAKHFVTGMLYWDTNVYGAFNNLRIVNRSTVVESSEADGTYSLSDTFTAFSGESPTNYTDTFNISCSTDRNFLRTVTIDGEIKGYDTFVEDSNKLYWDMMEPADDGGDSHVSNDEFFFPLTKSPAVDQTTTNIPNETTYQGPYGQALYRFKELSKQGVFFDRCLSIAFPSGFHNEPPGNSSASSTVGREFNEAGVRLIDPPPQTGYAKKLPQANKETFIHWTGLLNSNPKESSFTHNERLGTIGYSITFDSRPLDLVPFSSKENIQVEDKHSRRDYAATNILGGNAIIQDRGSYTLPSRTVNYNAQFRPQRSQGSRFPYIPTKTYSYIYTALEQFNPNKLNPESVPPELRVNYYYYSWISDETESVDLIKGTVSKSVTWNYELRYTNYNYTSTTKKSYFAANAIGYAGMRIGNAQYNYPTITSQDNPYG
jgi:hypothetical protein